MGCYSLGGEGGRGRGREREWGNGVLRSLFGWLVRTWWYWNVVGLLVEGELVERFC